MTICRSRQEGQEVAAARAFVTCMARVYMLEAEWFQTEIPRQGDMHTDVTAQDRPIEHMEADMLGRAPFVENVVRALIVEERDKKGHVTSFRSTGMVIGLTGQWGSGKSSILNMVAATLITKVPRVAVATFNPWLVKGRDELLATFFDELRDALGRSLKERGRDVLTAFDKYRTAVTTGARVIGHLADAFGAGGVGHALSREVQQIAKKVKAPKKLAPTAERRNLESKLKAKKIAVVVLIDELDRVEDEDVRAVAQLVKAVGDIKGISYLVAYDSDRVTDALGRGTEAKERRRTGEAYLEKIIQHPIPLRPLLREDVDKLLRLALRQHGLPEFSGLTEDEGSILECVSDEITTPREIKRLAGSYAAIDRMVGREINSVDILGYCWLLTKAPSLRDRFAQIPEKLVDDPSVAESMERVRIHRSDNPASVESVLGLVGAKHERLIRHLFPRFGASRTTKYTGDRISHRRNLIRLLYLGNPPGMPSRTDVELLWHNSDIAALTSEFRVLIANNRLPAIIDRLGDLLPKLPPKGDLTFWPALSHALLRESDWIAEVEPNGALARDAVAYLDQFGRYGHIEADRTRKVIAALQGCDDLVFLPRLLSHHLRSHGLVKGAERSFGQGYLDKSQTESLRDHQLPRYRAAVLNGLLLRRNPNADALWVLSSCDAWDSDLRVALSQQLARPEVRATFAILVVPPGFVTDRASLDVLFGADAILAEMNRVDGKRLDEASSRGICLRRLKKVLMNESLMYADD